MVKAPALVSAVLVLLNVCVLSLSSASSRDIAPGGAESSGFESPKRLQLQQKQASLLQLSFGLRAVAETQAEMANLQERPSSSSSAFPVQAKASDSFPTGGAHGLGGFLDGSVGPGHRLGLLDTVARAAAWGNSNASEVARDSDSHGGGLVFLLGFVVGSLVCGLLPILGYAVARSLSKRIERGVESSDKTSFGVDIDVGKLTVNLCEGYIVVHGLTVFNPPGYSAEYLLKAETVNVDIRMATLVCSCFRTVQVDKIVFSGVDVLYDKSWSSSNIKDVINSTRAGGVTAEKSETSPKDSARCTMRKVLFEDVVVRQPMAAKTSLALAAADLDIQDFSAEIGESRLHVAAFAILSRVLKTAAANLEPVVVGTVCKQ